MSTPTPIFNPLQELIQAAVIAAVSKIVQAAGTTPAAQLARAQAILGVVTAIEEINSGNPQGIADIQGSLLALWKVGDPAMQVVVNTVIATVSTELETLAANGIIAKALGVTFNTQLGYIVEACNAYIQAYGPPTPAKP